MNSTLTRLPGNTVAIKLVVPWAEIKPAYDKILEHLVGEIELPGFRKGKAPRDLALKQIDQTRLLEETLKQVIPDFYAQLVREHQLQPIVSPQLRVAKGAVNEEFEFEIKVAETPKVELGDYQKVVADLKTKKNTKIWTPGADQPKEKKVEEVTVGELLDALYGVIKVELSELLVESEVNRLLSNLVADLEKLGLTVSQYLETQHKTVEQVRGEYGENAKKTLSLEFSLEAIADREKVTVEAAEVEEVINRAKTPEEKAALTKERYYLGGLLRRQKTLAHLLRPSIVQS